jgi:hypothetical protein
MYVGKPPQGHSLLVTLAVYASLTPALLRRHAAFGTPIISPCVCSPVLAASSHQLCYLLLCRWPPNVYATVAVQRALISATQLPQLALLQ